jgi:hypothetical protein
MRLSRKIIITIAVIPICLICASLSHASVVTIDAAGKTVKSDDSTLEPFGLQVAGQQVGICVNNTVVEPQIFTLRVSGLTQQSYDLYIDGTFKGSKSLKQISEGLSLRVDGSVTDPHMMRCVNAVRPTLQKLYDVLHPSKDPQALLACDTLSQALLWVKLSLSLEQSWRSVRVIIAPAGKALELMEWVEKDTADQTAQSITRACWLLQQARNRMSLQIKDPDMRNQVVGALTPIDFSASYSTKSGKPRFYAKLLNKCDLPISGAVSLELPGGWKSDAKKLKFSQLKSGQSFSVLCNLIAPSKTSAVPDSVTAAANVTLVQLELSASLKLSATAKANSK